MEISYSGQSVIINKNQERFSVLAFYYLLNQNSDEQTQEQLTEEVTNFKNYCNSLAIKGTILISQEGINGTVAGIPDSIEKFLEFLKNYLVTNKRNIQKKSNEDQSIFEYKISYADFIPFSKLRILNKSEVVSLKSDIEMDINLKPENANEEEWDELMKSKDVQLIDTRNDYEYSIGTFKGAINPEIRNFRDFKSYLTQALENGELDKEKTCAIFCTGGIRCEKAGIYMRNIGFKKVVQLQGGILKYLETTKNSQSNWQGDCFVFDDRVTVNDQLQPGELRCINCLKTIQTVEEKKINNKG